MNTDPPNRPPRDVERVLVGEGARGLIEAAPDIYFTIPHYDGYAMVLARMDAISDAELAHRLRLAWDMLATAKMRKE